MTQSEKERIARTLGIPTLEVRGRDSLDFHEVGVQGISRALEEAYKLGRQDAEAQGGTCIAYGAVDTWNEDQEHFADKAIRQQAVYEVAREMDLSTEVEITDRRYRDLKVYVPDNRLKQFLVQIRERGLEIQINCHSESQAALCRCYGQGAEANLTPSA
jgi:hypothetical protein